MPRVASAVWLDPTTKATLDRLVRSPSTRHGLVQRCRIVLAAAAGQTNQQIAGDLQMPEVTVSKWRRGFASQGLEGLQDAPRSGRPAGQTWPGNRTAGAEPSLPAAGTLQPLERAHSGCGLRAAAQHRAPDPGCLEATAPSHSHLYLQSGSRF